jgi:osmotically-inducible protein OsmY
LRGVSPAPPRTDDPGIERLTSRRLARVIVSGRTARLEGKVSSDVDRHRADEIARDAGAARVEDLLTVDPAAGEASRC